MIALPAAGALIAVALGLLLLLLIALAPLYRRAGGGPSEREIMACSFNLAGNANAECFCGRHSR